MTWIRVKEYDGNVNLTKSSVYLITMSGHSTFILRKLLEYLISAREKVDRKTQTAI